MKYRHSKKRPPIPDVPSPKTPKTGVDSIPKPSNWVFSFQYFNQTRYFGLERTDPSWFVSLLERLRDLCKEDRERFFRDIHQKDSNRYHEIDWNAKNIPISRRDLDWLPRDIIENETEFPFWQFHISRALGRVVGFWTDYDTIFNIVLLDPFHNIQPSKHPHNYKVTDCDSLHCHYSSLLLDIEGLCRHDCKASDCDVIQSLRQLPYQKHNGANFLYCSLDDEYIKELNELLRTRSLRDIIELGILAADSEKEVN